MNNTNINNYVYLSATLGVTWGLGAGRAMCRVGEERVGEPESKRFGVSVRPGKVDLVLAVGVSSSKPNNPKEKTKHTLQKKAQTPKVSFVILSTKNKFEWVFYSFSFF